MMIRTLTLNRGKYSENGVKPRVHMLGGSKFRFVPIVAIASVSLILCSVAAEVLDLHNPPWRDYGNCRRFCDGT